MKKFSFIESVLIALISILIGYYIGTKNSNRELNHTYLGNVKNLSNQIDSLQEENTYLHIELGRYNIIYERLLEDYPKVEEEVTKDLE